MYFSWQHVSESESKSVTCRDGKVRRKASEEKKGGTLHAKDTPLDQQRMGLGHQWPQEPLLKTD